MTPQPIASWENSQETRTSGQPGNLACDVEASFARVAQW